LREVLFSWQDPDTGEQLHFAVERLTREVKRLNLEVFRTEIDPKFAEASAKDRGLEPHRLARLLEVPIPDWEPLVFCRMPDDTCVLVDGNHRYYVAWQLGEKYVLAYIVPQDVWSRFIVDFPHIPGNIADGFSGIL
jgi:hypothetical protein